MANTDRRCATLEALQYVIRRTWR